MWLQYVKGFNKKNPHHPESWFDPLQSYYQSSGLERIIETGIQNPSTAKIAKLAEREWLNVWLREEQYSPKVAFGYLHLDDIDEMTLLSNFKFKMWTEYLDDFNRLYPEKKTTMIDSLRANYDDNQLLAVFTAAKKDPSTEKLATNLQSDLISK